MNNIDLENPAFLVVSLVAIVFIIAGLIMLKFPPKSINLLYGYRTFSAMKSKERWDFAQKYSSKEMIKWGILLLLVGILLNFISFSETQMIIAVIILPLIPVIILVYKTEKAIKQKFKNEK
jgi:uncharacterized membrane protein